MSDKLRLLFFRASAWIKWCDPFSCPLACIAFVGFVFNATDDGSKSVPPFEAFSGLAKREKIEKINFEFNLNFAHLKLSETFSFSHLIKQKHFERRKLN